MWNPYVELEFCNPDKGAFTCVGYAPSAGRRCRKPIAAHNRAAVTDMLNTLASKPPTSSVVADFLQKIAPLSLCVHYHQNQAEEVVCDWKRKIRSMKTFKSESSFQFGQSPDIRSGTSSTFSDSSSSYTERETIMLKRENKVLKGQNSKLESETRKLRLERDELMIEKSQLEMDKLMLGMNKMAMQLELDNVKRELESLKEKERERSDDSQQGEREAQEKEQQERERQRKEKEKRERDEQNERIRQAAQRKREEKERQKRETVKREKKEWEEAWKQYTKRWTVFQENIPNPDPDIAVPWPVKTGRYADVTEPNIQAFFDNACPDQDSPEKLYRIMSDEARKWHPDKILSQLAKNESMEGAKGFVEIICMVVVKMRRKAGDGRRK